MTINETLIVINAIAVMRAGLRGGIWSTMGKNIEKPLIVTLCKILKVDAKYYKNTCIDTSDNPRESDFFLENEIGNCFRCEVKLMGKGNPESADGAMARNAAFFLADKLSDQNKSELNRRDIKWVAMADPNLLQQVSRRLNELHIPNTPYNSELTEKFIDEYLE
ncbi:MAG: restriction endonuclease [Cenarchaeum symbiont of Oopsacas minuta]|nr:restriction endonuclease [Cenarchaeum symbiont of Oopsacas minuta]